MPNPLPIIVALALSGLFPARERMRSGPLVRELGANDARHGELDLDGDHVADCWSVVTDSGSGFGSLRVEVRPACGAQTFVLEEASSFGELVSALDADGPRLPRAFTDGLARAIYGSAPSCERAQKGCRAIDPAFAWLLDEGRSRGRDPSAWRTFTPRPQRGRPTLPNDEVIARDEGGALAGFVSLAGGWIGSVLLPSARCGSVQLWRCEHGVIAEDLARHTWQWVYLSTGLDKLRWPSIAGASCAADGRTITVLRRGQDFAPERITVIPAAGRWRSEPLDEDRAVQPP